MGSASAAILATIGIFSLTLRYLSTIVLVGDTIYDGD
ncbi:hypothetical protein LEP3755_39500 [Leptolyngbya sp. NIES-3755]|nr:hypothetical protein LEP3755_39500 [Leptolyngbya sp. NIES-3755]